MRKRVAALYRVGDAEEALVLCIKASVHLLFGIESLYDTQSAKCLFDSGKYSAPLLLCLEAFALKALAHLAHDQAGQRKQDKDKDC